MHPYANTLAGRCQSRNMEPNTQTLHKCMANLITWLWGDFPWLTFQLITLRGLFSSPACQPSPPCYAAARRRGSVHVRLTFQLCTYPEGTFWPSSCSLCLPLGLLFPLLLGPDCLRVLQTLALLLWGSERHLHTRTSTVQASMIYFAPEYI